MHDTKDAATEQPVRFVFRRARRKLEQRRPRLNAGCKVSAVPHSSGGSEPEFDAATLGVSLLQHRSTGSGQLLPWCPPLGVGAAHERSEHWRNVDFNVFFPF